jgi:hypothetical protein
MMLAFMQEMKAMRLTPKQILIACSLCVLPWHGVAAKEAVPFGEFQASIVETVMKSCMRSQMDHAIQIYMKSANTHGANFADHAQTLAYLEKLPEWSIGTVPTLKNRCTCAFGPSIEEMRKTTSLDALEDVVRTTKAAANQRGADSAYMNSCMLAQKASQDAD